MAYIRARVTEESFEGWYEFTREQGVTVSAFVEAMGLMLAQRQDITEAEMTHWGRWAVTQAREIDADRRRRRRGED